MKYRVHGYCLMPAEAQIEIEAATPEEALQKAMSEWDKNKFAVITPGSVDEAAAFAWQPTVEAV